MYDIVNKLVNKYKTSNPEELAEAMNIKLIFADLGENVRGLYQHFQRGKIICINESLGENEIKLVLAHEIGHAVLHPKMNRAFMDAYTLNVPGRYENEADLFAAYLLIDDYDIKEFIICEYTYQQISNMTGIKQRFVEERVKDYKERFDLWEFVW